MPIAEADEIRLVREDLLHIPPPYLLRKYEATEEYYEELADEDLRCELLDGVLVVHSPASIRHEDRLTFLTTLVNVFVASRGLGRVYAPNTVVQLGHHRLCPDLSFLATEHAGRIQRERIVGPADLVVEMISDSTREYDPGDKRGAYHDGRVPEIWFIDADRRQCQFDLLEGDAYNTRTLVTGRFAGHVLAGLVVDVEWFWSEPLPNPLECLKLSLSGT
jgi:Uma2 family endonuclease